MYRWFRTLVLPTRVTRARAFAHRLESKALIRRVIQSRFRLTCSHTKWLPWSTLTQSPHISLAQDIQPGHSQYL